MALKKLDEGEFRFHPIKLKHITGTRLAKFRVVSESGPYKHNIRVIEIDGEPWFVAAEHAKLLYNTTTGLTHVYARLDANEKKLVTRADGDCFHLFGTSRAPRLLLISESGLYKLIMRSDKPGAKTFQDWVTREVLPAIRKDGGYVMAP